MAAESQYRQAGPHDYVAPLDAALSGPQREQRYFWHALPPLWRELEYADFLVERRVRMAKVIKAAWDDLSGKPQTGRPRWSTSQT